MTQSKTTLSISLLTALVLGAGSALAGPVYPEVSRLAAAPAPIDRPCTQLEQLAGIKAEECGRKTVHEVVRAMNDNLGYDDDNHIGQ